MRKWIDKISAWMVGFGIEFYMHIVCVLLVSAVLSRVFVLTGADHVLAGCLAAFAGFVVGFAKEIYDNKTTGVFQSVDILADAIGAGLFLFIFM